MIFDSKTPGLDQQLRAIASKADLRYITLSIGTAPPRYEVSKAADVTAVVYSSGRRNKQVVTANFALRPGELDRATEDAIVRAIADVLPK